jgi:Abhydrolase family
MSRLLARGVAVVLAALYWVTLLPAQVRTTPKEAKGGEKQGAPWAVVPESFRGLKIPEWPVPSDLQRWLVVDRDKTRTTLLRLLGEMPTRPDPGRVKVVSKEDRDGYTLERFEFHNGVDMVVPGILLIPHDRKGPTPAIIGLHGHGSSKESICTDSKNSQFIGPALAKRGYVHPSGRGNGDAGACAEQGAARTAACERQFFLACAP